MVAVTRDGSNDAPALHEFVQFLSLNSENSVYVEEHFGWETGTNKQ